MSRLVGSLNITLAVLMAQTAASLQNNCSNSENFAHNDNDDIHNSNRNNSLTIDKTHTHKPAVEYRSRISMKQE